MADFDKMSIRLFENDHKKAENHPDKRGSGNISRAALGRMVERMNANDADEIELECAGWLRESAAGNTYMGIVVDVVNEKYAKKKDAPEETKPFPAVAEDDVPF